MSLCSKSGNIRGVVLKKGIPYHDKVYLSETCLLLMDNSSMTGAETVQMFWAGITVENESVYFDQQEVPAFYVSSHVSQ